MSETLEKYLKNKNKKIKILDMGSGSGIQAETCLNSGFVNVTAADIDVESVNFNKKKGINAIKSNLFSNVEGKFDLIVFNPPYLPEDKHDKARDTSGGRKGDETILRFLNQSKKYLTNGGEVLLLLSSYTPRVRINNILKDFKAKKISEKKLFYEKLEILLLSLFEV